MTSSPRIASISLDLDDLWTYLRTHGDPSWASRPSYLEDFVPLVLDTLDELGVKLTFFLVGADAAAARNRRVLRAIVDRGHEVGNHSFEHEPWLHRYTQERLEAELLRTQEAIADATGQRPYGFRGPGYSWSIPLLELLVEHGYRYDASTLPTYLGPLARAYYFWASGLSREERARRHALFGTLRDGLRPVRPYQWQLEGGRTLLEIPVTTLPALKLPFHLTYIQYLSRYSEAAAVAYLRSCLALCDLARLSPSFILHPLDILGGDRVPQLAFFPAMDLSTGRKLALFRRVLGYYGRTFRLVTMGAHARELSMGARLPLYRPSALPVERPVGEA
ncbi:MAG TPA: polysaccharide deacetylase family protein [Gemmatimonadales bacterium]